MISYCVCWNQKKFLSSHQTTFFTGLVYCNLMVCLHLMVPNCFPILLNHFTLNSLDQHNDPKWEKYNFLRRVKLMWFISSVNLKSVPLFQTCTTWSERGSKCVVLKFRSLTLFNSFSPYLHFLFKIILILIIRLYNVRPFSNVPSSVSWSDLEDWHPSEFGHCRVKVGAWINLSVN